MYHTAIIVTGSRVPYDDISSVYRSALKLFGQNRVSSLVDSQVGSFSTFLVAPSGDERMAEMEADWAQRREQFKNELQAINRVDWVEIAYGEDNENTPAWISSFSNRGLEHNG